MINVSISYGFGKENRYNLESIPQSIQLALHKYEKYVTFRDEIYRNIEENNINVVAVHMPLDILKIPFKNAADMIDDLYNNSKCKRFVIHPNKGIGEFLSSMDTVNRNVHWCIETFGWKSNKVLRTPLNIIEFIIATRGNYSMVLDTSHVDEVWFDHRVLPFLLDYTSIIHLSNRAKGVGQHLPFNDQRGSLNLVLFVKELKRRYHWNGDIVLEYMEDYKHKLHKNSEFILELLK